MWVKSAALKEGERDVELEEEKVREPGQNEVITIPVTTGAAVLRGDPGSLKQQSKAAPEGLMGRQRSTTPFLTHHMLKEFGGALWV